MRKLNRGRCDALSISNYKIRKKSAQRDPHGKSEEQTFCTYRLTHRKTNGSGNHYVGILDRFLKDARYRESQTKVGWTEAECKEMDGSAQEDHTYKWSLIGTDHIGLHR